MAENLRNVGGISGAEQPQNSPGFSDSAPEMPPTFRSLCNPDRSRLDPTPLRDKNEYIVRPRCDRDHRSWVMSWLNSP